MAKLGSTEDQVRRSAARFVAAAAVDPLFAALLYDTGCVVLCSLFCILCRSINSKEAVSLPFLPSLT